MNRWALEWEHIRAAYQKLSWHDDYLTRLFTPHQMTTGGPLVLFCWDIRGRHSRTHFLSWTSDEGHGEQTAVGKGPNPPLRGSSGIDDDGCWSQGAKSYANLERDHWILVQHQAVCSADSSMSTRMSAAWREHLLNIWCSICGRCCWYWQR